MQVLAPGRIVTLSCSGQITVDGVGVTLTTTSQAGRDGEERARTRDAVSMGGSYGDITSSRGPPSPPLGVELKGKNWSAVTVSHNWPSGEATPSAKDATMFQHKDATSVEVGDVSRTKARAPRQAGRPVKASRAGVYWKLNGRPIRVTGEEADTLHLGPILASKSGNYSCHQGRKMIFSVKIVVEGECTHKCTCVILRNRFVARCYMVIVFIPRTREEQLHYHLHLCSTWCGPFCLHDLFRGRQVVC